MTNLLVPTDYVEPFDDENNVYIEDYERMKTFNTPWIIDDDSQNSRCSNCKDDYSICLYFAYILVIFLFLVSSIQCGAGYWIMIKSTNTSIIQQHIDKISQNNDTRNGSSPFLNNNDMYHDGFIFAKNEHVSNDTNNRQNISDESTFSHPIIADNYLFCFVFYQFLPIIIAELTIFIYIVIAIKYKHYIFIHSHNKQNIICDLLLFSLSFLIFGGILCIINYFMLIRLIILLKWYKDLKYKTMTLFNKLWNWICNDFLITDNSNKSESNEHEKLKRIIVIYYYLINKYYEYKHSEKRRERNIYNNNKCNKCNTNNGCCTLLQTKKECNLWNYKEMITNEVEFNASCTICLYPNIDIPFNNLPFNFYIKIGEFSDCLYRYDAIFRYIQLYILNGSIWINILSACFIQHIFIFNILNNNEYKLENISISLSEIFIFSDICFVLFTIYNLWRYKKYNYALLDCFNFDLLKETFCEELTNKDNVIMQLTHSYSYYNDKREIAYILCNILGQHISNIVLQYAYKHYFYAI